MDHASEYDLIVIGGGPGGSTVATLVAMQGHRVLLLEREKGPSYKIGESLLPATVHGICPLLGVSNKLKSANFVTKLGGTFVWGKNPEPWTFLFSTSSKIPGPTSTAYQVERIKFDRILLDNAREKGVEVREQHAVSELLMDSGRVTGVRLINEEGQSADVRSRYVADASGSTGSFFRQAGERVYSQFFQNVAVFAYYRNGGRLPAPNSGNILCVAFDYGWFWYIPLSPTLTSVGAVIGKEHAASVLKEGYETGIENLIRSCPRIQQLLSAAERVTEGHYGEVRVRKDYSYCNTRFWHPGLVLIGDAACFIDPVFSSGVHLATYSALLAARSINTCLRQQLPEDLCFTEFEKRYRREFGNFYDFLIGFYDLDQDLDSYFWHARKIVNSPETGNQAFINLVAGLSATNESLYSPEEFLRERAGLGTVLFPDGGMEPPAKQNDLRRQRFFNNLLGEVSQIQLQALLGDRRPRQIPLFPGGLITSPDGFHWDQNQDVRTAVSHG